MYKFGSNLLWTFSSLIVGACFCQTINNTQTIIDSIIGDYNPDIRPMYDQTEVVQVNFSLELVNVKELDEVAERLTVVGIIFMSWIDQRLAWNPFDHNDTYMITFPIKYIWKPNLFLKTPFGEVRPIGGGANDWALVKIFSDGVIIWSQADTISSSCSVTIKHFPFDEQVCILEFLPWGYLGNEITLYNEDEKVLLSYFSENGAWDLVRSSVMAKDVYDLTSMLFVEITLQRRPIFFIVNVIMPVVFISILNVFAFLIPIESGERVSYAITVYLALAVFMTIVADNMPRNSNHMATLCYYLFLNVGHSTLICIETILCLAVAYRKGPIPSWVVRLFTRGTKTLKRSTVDMMEFNDNSKSGENLENDTVKYGGDVSNKLTWKDVSHKMDKWFGFISIILLITFVISYLVRVLYKQ